MQITWFGHSAFRLDFAGHAVLIDHVAQQVFLTFGSFSSAGIALLVFIVHLLLRALKIAPIDDLVVDPNNHILNDLAVRSNRRRRR